jgi:hypothetical protein
MWHLADLRFAGPSFWGIGRFIVCGFEICRPKLFCALKTFASLQIQTDLITFKAYIDPIQICEKIKQSCAAFCKNARI